MIQSVKGYAHILRFAMFYCDLYFIFYDSVTATGPALRLLRCQEIKHSRIPVNDGMSICRTFIRCDIATYSIVLYLWLITAFLSTLNWWDIQTILSRSNIEFGRNMIKRDHFSHHFLSSPARGLTQWENTLLNYIDAQKQPWDNINTLSPRQNGRHFADDIFKCIFFNENICISIKISLKFVPKCPINNIPALVQIMAWCRPGDRPLSEAMMVNGRIYASLV